jgi:DNA repair exonuclease SbcCD ATPase subunit
MLDGDLLLAFAFMALLFLRQISIIKQPNKINYAPLMIGLGVISSVVHFIMHPETAETLLILKESFLPLLVSLLLYMVMNILHQTQQSDQSKTQHEFTKVLIEQITQLKEFTSELEKKMIISQNEDKAAQEEVREKFKQDIKALGVIQTNQTKFLEKFEQMQEWHVDVTNAFENFTKVQLPSLDDVVHKHIDILRIAEQDHFNKVKATLARAVESRGDMAEELDELKESLQNMSSISQNIANEITKATMEKLSVVTRPYETQVMSLKSHTEGVNTSLYESENRLNGIKEQSEMIMKQMVLSSKKMKELENQNSGLHDIYSTMKELMSDIEVIKSEYVKSQAQLSMIIKDFNESKNEEINDVKDQMESLIVILTTKVDNSLDKLHNHYNIANEDISKSVQFLAKQAQVKNIYSDLDS